MNNPDYFISTAVTGDSGQGFLDILNPSQRALITGIIDEQRSALAEIAQIRTTVSAELRKAMTGETVDKEKVYSLIERYGALDGQMSGLYAARFAEVNRTLTVEQKAALIKLRNLDVVPQGAYCFSTPVAMPEIPGNDYFFGVGSMPADAGQTTAPQNFSASSAQGPGSQSGLAGKGGPADQPQGKDGQGPPPPKNTVVKVNGKDVVFDVPPVIKRWSGSRKGIRF